MIQELRRNAVVKERLGLVNGTTKNAARAVPPFWACTLFGTLSSCGFPCAEKGWIGKGRGKWAFLFSRDHFMEPVSGQSTRKMVPKKALLNFFCCLAYECLQENRPL